MSIAAAIAFALVAITADLNAGGIRSQDELMATWARIEQLGDTAHGLGVSADLRIELGAVTDAYNDAELAHNEEFARCWA